MTEYCRPAVSVVQDSLLSEQENNDAVATKALMALNVEGLEPILKAFRNIDQEM